MVTSQWMVGVLVLAAYLLGSIPFGILAARCLGVLDPRRAGSRNIGFTNVLRVSGKAAAVATLAGDIGKGWLAVWGARQVLESEVGILLVALAVVLGHVYSVFLRFQGGKGVATAIGAVLGVAPWVGLALVGLWFAGLGLSRYSAGAAVIAFAGLPALGAFSGRGSGFVAMCLAVSVVVIYRHKENLVRWWHGTESRV